MSIDPCATAGPPGAGEPSRVLPAAQDPWADVAAVPDAAPLPERPVGVAVVPAAGPPPIPVWMSDAATMHRGSQFPDASPVPVVDSGPPAAAPPQAGTRFAAGSAAVPTAVPAVPTGSSAVPTKGSAVPTTRPAAVPAAGAASVPGRAVARPGSVDRVVPRPVSGHAGPPPMAGRAVPAAVSVVAAARPRPRRLRGFLRFVGRVVLLVGLVLLPVAAALLAYGINNGDPLADDFRELLAEIGRLVRRWL